MWSFKNCFLKYSVGFRATNGSHTVQCMLEGNAFRTLQLGNWTGENCYPKPSVPSSLSETSSHLHVPQDVPPSLLMWGRGTGPFRGEALPLLQIRFRTQWKPLESLHVIVWRVFLPPTWPWTVLFVPVFLHSYCWVKGLWFHQWESEILCEMNKGIGHGQDRDNWSSRGNPSEVGLLCYGFLVQTANCLWAKA